MLKPENIFSKALRNTTLRLGAWQVWVPVLICFVLVALLTIGFPAFLLMRAGLWPGLRDAFSPSEPGSITNLAAPYWALSLALVIVLVIVQYFISLYELRERPRNSSTR